MALYDNHIVEYKQNKLHVERMHDIACAEMHRVRKVLSAPPNAQQDLSDVPQVNELQGLDCVWRV